MGRTCDHSRILTGCEWLVKYVSKIFPRSVLKGWHIRAEGLSWQPLAKRELGSGWARLELVLGGVCATDYQLLAGYADFHGVIGHEFCARVVECEEKDWLGALVVGDINVGCGRCPDARFCPHRQVLGIRDLDGVFAESFALPLENLVRVDDLDPSLACWAEPLAAALELHRHLGPGEPVLVLGDGRLASLISASLVEAGHPVDVLGRHAEKLERLRQLDCHTHLRLPDGEWPVVVEASGSPLGLEQALRLTAPLGKVILKSTTAAKAEIQTSPIVVKALQVIGSRCGLISEAVQWLRQGRLDPRPWVSQVVSLEELPQAMQRRNFKLLVSGPGIEPSDVSERYQ